MARIVAVSLAVLAAVALVQGYGSGAPKDACVDMVPQHHTDPQKSPFPYIVTSTKKSIKAGDKVTLTITVGPTKKDFKGFFLQARVGNVPIGKFSATPGAKLVDCGSGKSNAVTHSSADTKTKIAVEWTAPPNLSENVNIYATVAENGGVFWVQQLAKTLTVRKS